MNFLHAECYERVINHSCFLHRAVTLRISSQRLTIVTKTWRVFFFLSLKQYAVIVT
jgi:hypothetical protein